MEYKMLNYEFPWKEDDDGDYLVIRSNEVDRFEVRRQTSTIFRYMGELAMYNHVWIEMPEIGETEETVMGVRLWERSFNEKMGAGAFEALCGQMIMKGFMESDELSELDIQAYEHTFPDSEEDMIARTMANFDSEWRYVSQEPGWQ